MKWLNRLKSIAKATDGQSNTTSFRGVTDDTMQRVENITRPPDGRTDVRAPKASPLSTLTQRELQVFNLLIQGQTLAKTAELMGIKYTTVNTHQKSIYKKLGVNSRAECILRYGMK